MKHLHKILSLASCGWEFLYEEKIQIHVHVIEQILLFIIISTY